ncbi:MAG: glycosyltransferase [Candidatus Rokubacteria bacterium]|nr:glycosyltransferase [Candidatus Rokubacteria bacterium]
MGNPRVTIVVVPRERFSYAERTLGSIYEHTTLPFKLVWVSAGTPRRMHRRLELESEQRGFQLIHTPRYLSPNQARNLGLRAVDTEYVAFLDNDALVTPGWLEALVRCAEETTAWVVGPLYLIGNPRRGIIHMAGGTLRIREENGRRVLHDEQNLFETPLSAVSEALRRQPWDYVEFHCMLVRTDVFEHLGPLDEALLSHHEHLDICLGVRRAGGLVYMEPSAVTSYVPPSPRVWWDLPYFMLRWSEAWNLATIRHFNEKWDVSTVRFFTDQPEADPEDTVARWARGHRRLMAGLRVRSEATEDWPELPSEQAELMVAMFLAVDRSRFELLFATDNGRIVAPDVARDPQATLERLPDALREAEGRDLNLMIRPLPDGRPNQPALVRLDDLDAERARAVQPHAFLTLETNPGRYQCWLAVARGGWRGEAALARLVGGADLAAGDGAGRTRDAGPVAGSRRAGSRHLATDAACPRVRLVEAVAGHLTTPHQLERSEVVDCLGAAHLC